MPHLALLHTLPWGEEGAMWQPDGWDASTRIGVLTPHADVGPESELQAMAPKDVRIHGARVLFRAMRAGGEMDPTIALAPVRAFAEPPYVDDATELLAAAPVRVIAYGFTSSAYLIGGGGEAAMIARLQERSHGIPVVATCAAAVLALGALGARRLAVVHPPWFGAELDGLGARYFADEGFEVVFHASADLPSDQRRITPATVYEWARAHVPDTAEAVFFGGNGFRAVGMIGALEEALGRPVLSANQVLLWQALRAARLSSEVTGYGRIMSVARDVTGQ